MSRVSGQLGASVHLASGSIPPRVTCVAVRKREGQQLDVYGAISQCRWAGCAFWRGSPAIHTQIERRAEWPPMMALLTWLNLLRRLGNDAHKEN
ncbi:hypothetical protein E2C01_055409 [Portunus trituberculatus]|uniref:Uncharacterized protein n=1 Tax=Portunus trituberculatus TaxID=210409 RepID=A0A5B7GUX1_PORTR|nr:hypothetical protein [Portunus trituberculatus]